MIASHLLGGIRRTVCALLQTVGAGCYCPRDSVTFRSTMIYIEYKIMRGRDSSVGIATRYELYDPGIESRWGRDYQHLSRPALGPTQPPTQ
jgi:hypothetical protein